MNRLSADGQRRRRPGDPAPSRLSYRMQRLALTPMVRRGFTLGVPGAVIALIGGLAFADVDRRAAVFAWVEEVKTSFQSREEFMVRRMEIEGASGPLRGEIAALLPLTFPVSSFDLNLPAMQDAVAGLDGVREASLRVRQGGVLDIEVTERIPALVWRSGEGLELLDEGGHRVAGIAARIDRADLPLISGEGADRAAREALQIVRVAEPLRDRLRGLVRIGERRWDVILSEGQKIRLPETRAVQALEQVMTVHAADDLFGRDVILVDMRVPRRPTVRIRPGTAEALRQVKMSELGDD